MKIALASDHAGYELKTHLKGYLERSGFQVLDLGTDSEASVDYPDFAAAACRSVLRGDCDRGVLVCGSGVGMSIAANRFRGIRAVLCGDLYTAEYSRLHNDSNVLCLPGRLIGKGLAERIVDLWTRTPFEGGRHEKRVRKMDEFNKGE